MEHNLAARLTKSWDGFSYVAWLSLNYFFAVGEEAPRETLTRLGLRSASLFQLFSLLFFVMERVVYKTPVSFMFGASTSFALCDFVHTKHISYHELNASTSSKNSEMKILPSDVITFFLPSMLRSDYIEDASIC
jgi:hypothetical protein